MVHRISITYTSLPSSEYGGDNTALTQTKRRVPNVNWKLFVIISFVATLFIIAGCLPECHLDLESLWGRRVSWKNTPLVLILLTGWFGLAFWAHTFDGLLRTRKGHSFGTPLAGPNSEGNILSPIPVTHQLHCIKSIKKAISDYRYTGGSRNSNSVKTADCCLEVLRQATICHGNMPLIRPDVLEKRYTIYDDILKRQRIHYVAGNGMKVRTHYEHNICRTWGFL
ncbi:LOW QUALITY PROTEIN: hypothetical protein LZ30DRAFT_755010 [Colletotrichum cereale]|nr:LOW QUALITY PROTEIN: hypothetical protein LZ30DRAFT_755010 [Colletotrichum cereale]